MHILELHKFEKVIFNEGLQMIWQCALWWCKSLTFIKLPSTATEIGRGAFEYCTNLTEVTLNEGLKKICASAFWGCTSLSIINLPSTLTKVGESTFRGCTSLREVVLHEGLQEIEEDAFGECRAFVYFKFATVSKRAKNIIDNGITEIEDKLTANQYFEWRGENFWSAVKPSDLQIGMLQEHILTEFLLGYPTMN